MKIKNDRKIIRDYLERYGFIDVLNAPLIDQMRLFYFRPGELITRSYEKPEYLFFYVKGKSKVYQLLDNGKSLLCRFYHPPEIVGDVEIFSGKPNICNLQALTDVICIGIPIRTMQKAAQSNNKLLILLCSSLGKKLASFNMISAVNQNYPLENRLASYLAAVSEPESKDDITINELGTNNLTELADLLGSSYRHLTRTIKKFKDDGIIVKNKHEIKIIDKQRLSELAKDIYMMVVP